jgi:hypothetical protein
MAEQQALISTEGGRVGLARSRSDVQGDANASQKQQTDKNWVHKQMTEQNGQQICNYCTENVSNSNQSINQSINWSYRERREGRRPATPISSNVTRRKQHFSAAASLLQCKSFLGSQQAERAAGSDPNWGRL